MTPPNDDFPIAAKQTFTCRHGQRETQPTIVFAGAIRLCSCCRITYGSLAAAPPEPLCQFCRTT